MEEQSEIYTYLPHDLISDINIQSENTDVETPFEPKIICAKNETIKDTKDANTLCSNIKDKNTNFKLGSLSIHSIITLIFFHQLIIAMNTLYKIISIRILSTMKLCSINFFLNCLLHWQM